jgi:hypothetical protein
MLGIFVSEVVKWMIGIRVLVGTLLSKFEQNSAPTQGAHLHQVIFLRMQVDFVRPSDRGHSVAIQLVEAGQVQPRIFELQRIWRAAVAEDELSDGSPFRLPLVRKDSILRTWEIVPAALLETTVSLRNEREDAFFPLHSSGLSPLDKKT